MEIKIVIQEDELLIENAPVFFQKTESIFKCDWAYTAFPQKGEEFDFSVAIPTEIWDSLPEKEKHYLRYVGETSQVASTYWSGNEELEYGIEVKFYTTIVSLKKENTFTVYVEHPLFPNIPIEIEWNLYIIPRIGDNFLFSRFINKLDKWNLLFSWIKQISIWKTIADNYDVEIIQVCKDIWSYFENSYKNNDKKNVEDIQKWIGLCNTIRRLNNSMNQDDFSEEEIVNKNIHKAMYYMMEDISEIEVQSHIDQIIWNKNANKEISINIILRTKDN